MRNLINKDKKLIQLYVSKEKWEELRAASDSIEEPITTWCRRAIYGALRNWKAPGPREYPKCGICGKKHNEQEHFSEG